ncbi:NADP-dependent oxidoreductase [Pseudoalteromonas tunicata]|uniref:NADP-dependent oxidoreductase n=1 Tax=Pseudoalteromonas tunicata TaxID=314281 RepID=UPI00273F9453|nr:NADP-dependent oxidoreductase [Pseudoalteromonas tunicata]MDP4984345.1 NADP-dependent oxidoreductase [Pseudoalteromonas tunicata]MDP5213040.1 NADP-dependent oxidoreductase [Pseudoalteromonas tunicata]
MHPVKLSNRAFVINQFGSVDEFSSVERDVASLKSQQILIKTISAAVNPIDVKTRNGIGFAAAQNKENFPLVLGYDVCGEVIACGQDVSEFTQGDWVIGMVGFAVNPGCYQQYCLVDATEVIKVSAAKENTLLSGLCLAGLTALQGIRLLTRNLSKEQHIYINAARGGVGHLALQIARNLGFKVTAVTGEPKDKLFETLAIDAISYEVFYAGNQAAGFFDIAGGERGLSALSALKPGAQVVTVPTITAPQIVTTAAQLGLQCTGMLVENNLNDLRQLVDWYQNNQLELIIDSVFPMSDVAAAHLRVATGQTVGKVILLA